MEINMPGEFGAALNTALKVGQTIQTGKVLLAQKQRIIEDQQREMADLRSTQSPIYVGNNSDSDYDLAIAQKQLSEAKAELSKVQRELNATKNDAVQTQKKLVQTNGELGKTKLDLEKLTIGKKESDDLLLEWMQGNEAFKALTKKFGKKLGMTDDEIKIEISEAIVDVAEEDPQFANTKMTDRSRKKLGK